MSVEASTTDGPIAAETTSQFPSKDKLKSGASVLSPLIVALVVAGGLGVLCAENLNGSAVRQLKEDHSNAIQKLFFRS
jgi:cytoskeletal protein RodZ